MTATPKWTICARLPALLTHPQPRKFGDQVTPALECCSHCVMIAGRGRGAISADMYGVGSESQNELSRQIWPLWAQADSNRS